MDTIEKIKQALTNVKDVEFSKTNVFRQRTIINVNSSNPAKAKKALVTTEFATAIGATVVPMRKTKGNGFMVYIQDLSYPKPLYIRIRKGGAFASGIGNEKGLVATIESSLETGVTNVMFKDSVGGSFTVSDVASIRQTGNDAGSRMGNRGDVELVDRKGVKHRISIKKENANGVAGLKRYLDKFRRKIQTNLKQFFAENPDIQIHPQGWISVPVMNPVMFKFCWFGNDIDEGGGVIVGNFEDESSFTLSPDGGTLVVKCLRAFSPNDNLNDLMEGDYTGIYLLMNFNLRKQHLEIVGAKTKRMAGRYELPGFTIDDVTN